MKIKMSFIYFWVSLVAQARYKTVVIILKKNSAFKLLNKEKRKLARATGGETVSNFYK